MTTEKHIHCCADHSSNAATNPISKATRFKNGVSRIGSVATSRRGIAQIPAQEPKQANQFAQRRKLLGSASRALALIGASTAASSALAATTAFSSASVRKTYVSSEADTRFLVPRDNRSSQNSLNNTRRLSLYNTHTQQQLSVAFYRDGKYDETALRLLDIFLRDHRQNEAAIMDRMLYTQLWTISQTIGAESTIDVISGYRTPTTNKMLRSKGTGVARNSLHMQGRAIDFRLRDVAISHVRDAAQSLQAGGVGYYQASDFVHIDTGDIRHWEQY